MNVIVVVLLFGFLVDAFKTEQNVEFKKYYEFAYNFFEKAEHLGKFTGCIKDIANDLGFKVQDQTLKEIRERLDALEMSVNRLSSKDATLSRTPILVSSSHPPPTPDSVTLQSDEPTSGETCQQQTLFSTSEQPTPNLRSTDVHSLTSPSAMSAPAPIIPSQVMSDALPESGMISASEWVHYVYAFPTENFKSTPDTWSPKQVEKYFREQGHPELGAFFLAEKVNGSSLLFMSRLDATELVKILKGWNLQFGPALDVFRLLRSPTFR